MKILYIFGNGLDIAQGLATRYSDFYKYLESKEGSFLLDEMKDSISSTTELWSDMEVGLGVFTKAALGMRILRISITNLATICKII